MQVEPLNSLNKISKATVPFRRLSAHAKQRPITPYPIPFQHIRNESGTRFAREKGRVVHAPMAGLRSSALEEKSSQCTAWCGMDNPFRSPVLKATAIFFALFQVAVVALRQPRPRTADGYNFPPGVLGASSPV
jgi:hypothetical protein